MDAQGEITELRVALTVRDFDRAVALYRDALGLPVVFGWDEPTGVGVLAAGRATLEIIDERQAEHIDRMEEAAERAGQRLVGHAEVGEAVLTPWNDLNVRVRTPDGIQLTLFTPQD